MHCFSGEYECTMDTKGRIMLPSRLKNALPADAATALVVQRGFEPCLVLYALPEWQKVFEKVMALNEFDEEQRSLQRNLLRGNTEVELDGTGRLLFPKSMQKYAQLEKEIIMVGIGNRIEAWNPNLYEEFLIKDRADFSRIAEKFLGKEAS